MARGDPKIPMSNKAIAAKKKAVRDQRVKNLTSPLWKKGEIANAKGRPKGSRHKFSQAFCHDVLKDWQEHGPAVMAKVRENDPSTYLRVVSSLIPKTFALDDNDAAFDRMMDGLGDTELSEFIIGLRLAGRAKQSGADPEQAVIREGSDQVH